MVDYQNNPDPASAPADAGASAEATPGFLGTTTGKLVVGGIALVLVLAAVAAAVFYFVIGGALSSSVEDALKLPPIVSQPASETATQPPVEPTERSLASTFTFRNIFAPTVKKTFESTAVAGESTDASESASTDTSVTVPSNTLFLQSIFSDNGEPKAVFIWNGQTYTVGEGEQVGTSPWKVLQINDDSVLMLYGDSQVTLSVGQGVGK